MEPVTEKLSLEDRVREEARVVNPYTEQDTYQAFQKGYLAAINSESIPEEAFHTGYEEGYITGYDEASEDSSSYNDFQYDRD